MRGKYYDYDYVKNTVEKYECILLSEEYIPREKLKIQCKCGNIFYTKFYNFNNGNQKQCVECGKIKFTNKRTKSKNEIVNELVKHNCLLINICKNNKLEVKCQCGNKFYSTLTNLRQKKFKCTKCNTGRIDVTHSHKYVERNIDKSGCKLLNTYKNNRSKLQIQCKCGSVFTTSYKLFCRGQNRCDLCSKRISKPELIMQEYLTKQNIIFVKQYKFSDLKINNRNYLRFDFAIFNLDMSLKFLLELDGEYHYKNIRGEQYLLHQQTNDEVKNNYCKEHNIKLIRIPYWEFEKMTQIILEHI